MNEIWYVPSLYLDGNTKVGNPSFVRRDICHKQKKSGCLWTDALDENCILNYACRFFLAYLFK